MVQQASNPRKTIDRAPNRNETRCPRHGISILSHDCEAAEQSVPIEARGEMRGVRIVRDIDPYQILGPGSLGVPSDFATADRAITVKEYLGSGPLIIVLDRFDHDEDLVLDDEKNSAAE